MDMPAIRRGGVEDLAAIAAIQAASPEAAQWQPADYLAQLLLVATSDAGTIGFVVARPVADGEFEILNLAVAPEFRRHGIARQLLDALLREYCGSFYLEVRESNNVAQICYKSLGFQPVARRPGYYATPSEAAIVMKFHSC